MRVIAGCARGRQLKTKKGMETRPTADRVKESVFNILTQRIAGAHFLDIFAGNGGMGIEALSRGATKCVFIEKNNQCVTIIKGNLALCGLQDRAAVLSRDAPAAVASLQRHRQTFDIIFLDPPYHSPDLAKVMRQLARDNILAADGIVIVEHHIRDTGWRDESVWQIIREKVYGDTAMTFLVPAAAGGPAVMPQKGGAHHESGDLPGQL